MISPRLPIAETCRVSVGLLLLALPALLPLRSAAAPPPNDNRANATVITGTSGRLVVSNVDATKEAGEVNHAGNAGGRSIWFTYTPTSGGSTRIDTVGTGFDTLMSIFVGTSPLVGAANDQLQNGVIFNTGSGGYTESRISFTATAGATYVIAVDGYNAGTGALSGPIVLNWNQVIGVPPNDSFANATVLAGDSGGYSGRNGNGTKEAGEPSHAGNAGGRSVWYRWTPAVSGTAFVDVQGSSFDTLLAVYTGAAVNALTEIGSSDDLNNLLWQGRVTFDAEAGATYHIAVDGYNGGSGSVALHYGVSPMLPANDGFASAEILPGAQGSVFGANLNATAEINEPLHAGAAGGRSVWYSWTAPGDGMATFSTLGVIFDSLLAVYTGEDLSSLEPVAQNDDVLAGILPLSRVSFLATSGTVYHVAVDGFGGDYGAFSLNWDQALNAPTNDLFAFATSLEGYTGTIVTSNSTAVYEPGEPLVSIIGTTIYLATFGGKSLWFKWTAPASRPVTFDTLGSTFDTTLAVLTGSDLATLSVVTNNDNTVSNSIAIAQSRLILSNVVAGTTYYIQVDGANFCNNRLTPNGTVVLNYSQPGGAPTNDFFMNAEGITGESGQRTGSTLDATVEEGEPEHAALTPESSVWFLWTAPRNGYFTFDTLLTPNSGLNTVLAVYTGTNLTELTEVVSNDDDPAGGISQSTVTFLASAGVTYRIVVGSIGQQDTFVLRWGPASVPNNPPTLAPIANRVLNILSTLRFTNNATDPDLPANILTYSLGPGSPSGARLNPTNGLFIWTPQREHAGTTNLITITVTDDATPPLSDSRSFTVIVNNFIELTPGTTALLAGQTGSVPVTVNSSMQVTGLTVSIAVPLARLTNWTLEPQAPFTGRLEVQGNPDRLELSLGAPAGQFIQGTQVLARLAFTSISNLASAFLPLPASNLVGIELGGTTIPVSLVNQGRVALIVNEPLVEATRAPGGERVLGLYGKPGTTYTVQTNGAVLPAGAWTAFTTVTLTNITQAVSNLGSAPILFHRARE